MVDDLLDIVPTRAMLEKGIKPTDFKATVFEEISCGPATDIQQKAQKRKQFGPGSDDELPAQLQRKRKDDTEFNMKRARHEVIRFGSSGFESQDKKRAQIALAIKLGAKPPKAEYKNYKELLAEKKCQEDAKESARKLAQLGKNQTGAASVRCKPKKFRMKKNRIVGDISEHYGVTKPKLFKKKRR